VVHHPKYGLLGEGFDEGMDDVAAKISRCLTKPQWRGNDRARRLYRLLLPSPRGRQFRASGSLPALGNRKRYLDTVEVWR
jgi:hypothetical protein